VAPRFILASGSPRRRDLLAEAGFDFEVMAPAVAETVSRSLTVRELAVGNATRKALEIARLFPDAVVLGADTLVALRGEVIGKPADLVAATKTLQRLSGQSHEVWTAVCICHLGGKRRHTFHDMSRVRFRPLTDKLIAEYFNKVNPLDKAGAYAAQGESGREIIARIEGSVSNVIGLPMEKTSRALRAFRVRARD
jgi:septum formation protein